MTLNDMICKFGLEKIDNLSKYPSIETLHAIGAKGGVCDKLVDVGFPAEDIIVTEKIDGTNMRIICLGDDYLIGTRKNLVFAKGDRIINEPNVLPVLSAMENMREYNKDDLLVVFGEAYGGRIGSNASQYTKDSSVSFRVFDAFAMDISDVCALMDGMTASQINGWSNNNNQPFFGEKDLVEFCHGNGFMMTPRLRVVSGGEIPTDIESVMAWMEDFKDTVAVIGGEGKASGKFGRSEGVVCRTKDRKYIKKLRFEDYSKGKLKGFYRE